MDIYWWNSLATMAYSWSTYGGDVSYGRLASKALQKPHVVFILQVATHISVNFNAFDACINYFFNFNCVFTSAKSVGKVLLKSLTGYGLALELQLLVGFWFQLTKNMQRVGQPIVACGSVVYKRCVMVSLVNAGCRQYRGLFTSQLNGIEFLCFAIPITLDLALYI